MSTALDLTVVEAMEKGWTLIPWLFMEIGSTPSQTLIITEIDGKISQKVIKA